MKRDDQVTFAESAEERTIGYLRTWLTNEKFRAAIRRQDRPERDGNGQEHYVAQVRKRVCA